MRFVDPRNDVAFKKIFGNENRKGVLISFLNSLLDLAGTPKEIVEVSLLNPYQVPKLEGLKQTILDIRVVDKRNIHYIIEMQMFHTQAFEKRVLYYSARSYSDQLERGEDYPKLNQVIFIGFLDFVLFPQEKRYQTRHLILEEKSGEHFLKDIEFDFIELPKFAKGLSELETVKEKWIYFVKHAEELETIPEELKEPEELGEAFDAANRMGWSRDELGVYEVRGIYIQDERGRLGYAEEKGRQEGRQEGLQEGERRGVEKVARNLKVLGFPFDQIREMTGLSLEEIEAL